MSKCNCEYCQRYRKTKEALESHDFDRLALIVNELSNDLCNVEEDLNYKNIILSGQWPSSFHQLSGGVVDAHDYAWMEWAKEQQS